MQYVSAWRDAFRAQPRASRDADRIDDMRKKTTKAISVRLPLALYEKLQDESQQVGTSEYRLLVDIVEEYFNAKAVEEVAPEPEPNAKLSAMKPPGEKVLDLFSLGEEGLNRYMMDMAGRK